MPADAAAEPTVARSSSHARPQSSFQVAPPARAKQPANSTASGGKLRRPPEFANLGMGFESCGRRAQNGQRQAVASWDAWHPYPAREHVLCLGSPVALVGPALRCVAFPPVQGRPRLVPAE
ncbi:hypothetical protein ACCO45_003994 [Purpureocillium lilacinum]|uniref:Uncharacterized protein n=1 Tax=Purpureocillium lilacinum TaxID=33203 RepID=A0ACC4E497_PURLI